MTLDVWDEPRGRALRPLVGHRRAISAVAFSPSGRTIVSGSWDDYAEAVGRGERARGAPRLSGIAGG